jgi:hypothetical protein
VVDRNVDRTTCCCNAVMASTISMPMSNGHMSN